MWNVECKLHAFMANLRNTKCDYTYHNRGSRGAKFAFRLLNESTSPSQHLNLLSKPLPSHKHHHVPSNHLLRPCPQHHYVHLSPTPHFRADNPHPSRNCCQVQEQHEIWHERIAVIIECKEATIRQLREEDREARLEFAERRAEINAIR